jgi:hypothetical protein
MFVMLAVLQSGGRRPKPNDQPHVHHGAWRGCRCVAARGAALFRPSLHPASKSAYPDGASRWFDTRPLPTACLDCGNHIDDSAEGHYTEECQPT